MLPLLVVVFLVVVVVVIVVVGVSLLMVVVAEDANDAADDDAETDEPKNKQTKNINKVIFDLACFDDKTNPCHCMFVYRVSNITENTK